MSTTVQNIYNTALAIMHEDSCEDYAKRTPGIINALMGLCWKASTEHQFGPHDMWTPVESMDDTVEGVDISIALSAMPYGLAAQLYLDEDPVRSASWWSVFEQNLAVFSRQRPADEEAIKDVYGGIEYNDFGRW